MAAIRRVACLVLLVSSAFVFAAADPKTSAAVRAEINKLISNKSKYPDYSTFLTYLQVGLNQYKTADLTPLAKTTMFIPNNKAIAAMPSKARTNTTLLAKIVPFHICKKKLTFAQFMSGTFPTCPTPVAPPLANTSYPIYIFRANPKLQFAPAKATVVAQRATVVAAAKALYAGTYFNAMGVDKVMKPPGVTW